MNKSVLIFIETVQLLMIIGSNHVSILLKNNYDVTVLCPKFSYNNNFFER